MPDDSPLTFACAGCGAPAPLADMNLVLGPGLRQQLCTACHAALAKQIQIEEVRPAEGDPVGSLLGTVVAYAGQAPPGERMVRRPYVRPREPQ